jgi:serine/threonine protein kinase
MPFEAPNEVLLYESIRKGNFKCPDYLSSYSVSLISGLLNTKPDQRLSATQALNHPWLSSLLTLSPLTNLNFNNLVHYLKLDSANKILMGYIASHTSDALLINEINKFLELNASKTGILSKEELGSCITSFGCTNIEEVFREMDVSKSKGINYSGKIMSSI